MAVVTYMVKIVKHVVDSKMTATGRLLGVGMITECGLSYLRLVKQRRQVMKDESLEREASSDKWDNNWLTIATAVAKWSKDPSRKVGCVIVDDRRVILSTGYNGLPRGVDDTKLERYTKPKKYKYVSHAEANAISNAAANGTALLGSTAYVTLCPCVDCARLLIQTGIRKVVVFAYDGTIVKPGDTIGSNGVPAKYKEDIPYVETMFKEAGVEFKQINDKGTWNGKGNSN